MFAFLAAVHCADSSVGGKTGEGRPFTESFVHPPRGDLKKILFPKFQTHICLKNPICKLFLIYDKTLESLFLHLTIQRLKS